MTNLYQSVRNLFVCFLLFSLPAITIAQPPTITYMSMLTNLTVPVNIANAHDGSNRLFIIGQDGKILVWDGTNTPKLFGDFGSTGANIILYGGERGLLSMAFHPQYDGVNNRYFFIYHNDVNGDVAITRCQTAIGNHDTVDNTSLLTNIITIPHPTNTNHNGGQLRFGPDGYLYFATGDGGGGNDVPNNAQNGDVLLGKMIRINIDQTGPLGSYTVPADNPYVSDPNIDDRIWNLGLRNPYRWSFDRLTGDMWIGDVGQDTWEEIDFRPAGSTGHNNFGWRCFEGYESTPGVTDCNPVDYVPPVKTYPNPVSGSSAVTGGFVYRGTEYPNFRGYYIATDVYSGDIYSLWPNGSGGFDSAVQASPITIIVAFGEAEDGTLYAVSQGTSSLYKIVATGGVVLPVGLVNFTGKAGRGYNELKWKTATEQSTARFYVEYSSDSRAFTRAGTISASRNATGSSYSFDHYINNKSEIFYRLAIEEDNGSISYSSIVKLSGTSNNGIRVYPTVINNGILNLDVNGRPLNSIKIINTNGMMVFRKDIANIPGTTSISLPALAKGIYMVELDGAGISQAEKIVIQ